MADYRSFMLTGYRQNPSNNKEGLQYFDGRGLTVHHYFSDWHNTDLKNWRVTLQSEHSGLDTSNGRYYCYSEGVLFSTVTLMYTNPNNRDFHLMLLKNGQQIAVSNDINGGGGSTHSWNGATVSVISRVAEGDYISTRLFAPSGSSSGTRGYAYGGNNHYNNWQIFYIAGAQRDQPA